jgi:hypothetical protein
MPELSGRTALVTGGAKRLGRAIAEALASEGADIVVHYRTSEDEAHEAEDHLQCMGVQAWTVQADLADAEQAQTLMGRSSELAGRAPDILVNSASIFTPSGVLDFDADELDRQFAVNTLAPLYLSRSFAESTSEGQIVNMLDARMLEFDEEHAAYHLSKRALFTLTRMLALELAPDIRVNGIAPGLILPPPGEDEAYLEALAHTVPLNRHGSADDIVRAVMFLVHSPFVTGQVIYVDGGRHMKGRMYGS